MSESCSSGGNFDFRFAVGTLDGCNTTVQPLGRCGTNAYKGQGTAGAECTDDSEGANCVGYLTHFYCAKVDKFSSFTLKHSSLYLRDVAENAELAVYQTGKLNVAKEGQNIPEQGQNTRVTVLDRNSSVCGMDKAMMATFLIYNVTLSDGEYKYKNRDPIGNGFVSTCDSDDECLFAGGDKDVKCLRDAYTGTSNCAKCVGEDIEDIRVLISYYGTTSGGDALLSGSSNPLNFKQFAAGAIEGDIMSV